jgi:lipopolysaccharide transport system permease protein
MSDTLIARGTAVPHVLITPNGIQRRKPSASELAEKIRRSIIKAIYIVRLDLKMQSFGLSLGYFWLLLEPALQAGAYYFLLKVVFAVQGADSTFAFFFIAITYWRSHATLVTAAPYFLVTKGQQYVEQNISLGVAYLEMAAQEMLLFLSRLVILFGFLIAAGYTPHWSWLFGFYVAIGQFAFSMALVVWLSMAGTMVRDIGKLVGHVVWLWWYLSPGLYSLHRVPSWAEPVLAINPFSAFIPAIHSAFMDNTVTWQHLRGTTLFMVLSIAVFALGWRTLKRFSYIMLRYI